MPLLKSLVFFSSWRDEALLRGQPFQPAPGVGSSLARARCGGEARRGEAMRVDRVDRGGSAAWTRTDSTLIRVIRVMKDSRQGAGRGIWRVFWVHVYSGGEAEAALAGAGRCHTAGAWGWCVGSVVRARPPPSPPLCIRSLRCVFVFDLEVFITHERWHGRHPHTIMTRDGGKRTDAVGSV
jgi:hypothetical protein